MMTISRYILRGAFSQNLELPIGSSILSAMSYNENIAIYALVEDAESEVELWNIKVFDTGEKVDILKEHMFLNTVIMYGLAYHVFYKKILR